MKLFFWCNNDEKGQMHTFEAIVAAIIIIGGMLFVVQATALTPLTSSTASVYIETQLQTMGQDTLSALANSKGNRDSDLKQDILNWDGHTYIWSGYTYRSASNSSNELDMDNSSLASAMLQVAVPRGIAHNIEFISLDQNNEMVKKVYIYSGDPSNNAVTISKPVVINESDILEDHIEEFARIAGIENYSDSNYYNTVNVRLTLWRM